ncbi:MAG: DUF1016 domain-containing protein [Rhodanobacter sp.]|nr:MAG: DUF1016 domain-containing protein [Rhodanobacter sp.]
MNLPLLPDDYAAWLTQLKGQISVARRRAALAVNKHLIRLYHRIGAEILARQSQHGWGAKVIEQLARDLHEAFPDIKGFSTSNLKYMRVFAETCPSLQFGQQAVDQLPWGHLITLLTQLDDDATRAWYAVQVPLQGWSRNVLQAQIRSQLHRRQGAALTNFHQRGLPEAAAAQAILKDPYTFDFLGLGEEASERDIEQALIRHIRHTLLELGQGFAFVGEQLRLEVGGDEFFLDLLFYHIPLKRYVVVELKAGDFEPAHVGQLKFYITAIDRQRRVPDDQPTIGLLLCRRQNRVVAEYALSDVDAPMGIAEYQLTKALPQPLDTVLPRIVDLEDALNAAALTDNKEEP